MFPTAYWTDYYWPSRYWPTAPGFLEKLTNPIRTRHLRKERWHAYLVDSSGTEYDLGWVDIPESGQAFPLTIPDDLADGTYRIKVETDGLGWTGLRAKSIGAVVIDSTASEPTTTVESILTDFRYDIHEGWLRLLWEGDVSPTDSGLVSAGIWLSNGVPDFGTDPDIILPLFSQQSTHQYIVEVASTEAATIRSYEWYEERWPLGVFWKWLWQNATDGTPAYAGLALLDSDESMIGSQQYISIPDRTIYAPPNAVIEEG